MLAQWHSVHGGTAPLLRTGARAAAVAAPGCRARCGRTNGGSWWRRGVTTLSAVPMQQHLRRGPAPAAAGAPGAGLSPEEEAAYEAFKAKRKAERQQQRDEHKRRRAFDPLTPRRAPAPLVSSPDAPPAAAAGGRRAAAHSAGGLSAAEADVRAGSPLEPDMDQLLAQMMASGDDIPEVEELPDDMDTDVRGEDGTERNKQAAQEAALRRQRVSVPARRRRLSPAQLRAASLVQSQADKLQRSVSASSSGSSASSASTSAAAAGAGASSARSAAAASDASNEELLRQLMGGDGGDEEDDDDDDINWEALGRFEEMEATAAREAQQREAQRQRAATRAAANAASQRPAPAAPQQQPKQPKQQQQPPQKQLQRSPSAASAASVAPPSAMDRDLAELEGLLGFLEAMEEGGSSGKRAGSRQSSAKGSSGSGDGDEIDWGQLEASLFGEGWEADLIRELEADLASDEGEEGQAAGGVAGAGAEEEEEGEPWADEVTNLLLGLVMASHQKYLERPLLDAQVPEEQRAQAVWSAPFVLLVLDDSRQQQLEYSNASAAELFGRGYLDLFGVAGHELVAPDEQSQAEWAFALRDAEDSFSRRSVIPRLALVGADGRRAVAKDVVVFRVDSLEDTPVGQAVLIRDWGFE